MQNIAIIVTLLFLPYWLLMPAHLSESLRGRIGVSLVFAWADLPSGSHPAATASHWLDLLVSGQTA